MTSTHAARIPLIGWLVCWSLLAGAPGCVTPQFPGWMYWPYDPPERIDYETPGDRIGKVESLTKQLASADPMAQRRITEELVSLIRTETDPLVREHVVRGLAVSTEPMAMAVLRAALNDDSAEVRVAACHGLAKHPSEENLAALTEALRNDASADVRQAVTRSLASFEGPEANAALAIALQDRDPAMQYLAVQSLRQKSKVDYGNDVNAWLDYARGGNPRPHRPTVAERIRYFVPFYR